MVFQRVVLGCLGQGCLCWGYTIFISFENWSGIVDVSWQDVVCIAQGHCSREAVVGMMGFSKRTLVMAGDATGTCGLGG
jgi:hypothetical protein